MLLPTANLHLHFTIERPTRCAVCRRAHSRRRPVEFCCEKCGVGLHSRCHWRRVASASERLLLTMVEVPGMPDVSVLFLCPGCRS